MSHTYSMCRSHLSARIWHSVIILIYCQSHSVSFLIIISLNLWSDSFLCSFFGLILSLVADSGSHVYLLGSKIKQQNKYELLSSHGRLLYTLLQRRVSQHDAMRVLVAFRISLQQHRQCTGRQSGNVHPGVSLRVQFSRVVYVELTTTLAGRHTAVHRWRSYHTSYYPSVRQYSQYEESTNGENTTSFGSKSTAVVVHSPGRNHCNYSP